MYAVRIVDSGKTHYLKFLFCQKKCVVTDTESERSIFASMEDIDKAMRKLVTFDIENTFMVDLSKAEAIEIN